MFLMSVTTLYLFGMCFFGLGAVVVSYPLLDPKQKKIIFTGTKAYKEQIKKELAKRKTDFGLFAYTDKGFTIALQNKFHTINWTEVLCLFGYKVDLFAVDEIRLDVFCENNIAFTLSEETPGWYVFLDKIVENLPQSKPNWAIEIAFPAFETNLTLIFEKYNKSVEEAKQLYYKEK